MIGRSLGHAALRRIRPSRSPSGRPAIAPSGSSSASQSRAVIARGRSSERPQAAAMSIRRAGGGRSSASPSASAAESAVSKASNGMSSAPRSSLRSDTARRASSPRRMRAIVTPWPALTSAIAQAGPSARSSVAARQRPGRPAERAIGWKRPRSRASRRAKSSNGRAESSGIQFRISGTSGGRAGSMAARRTRPERPLAAARRTSGERSSSQ